MSNHTPLLEATGRHTARDYTELYHVGDLTGDREKPRFSDEGKALSITTHPNAWRQIDGSGVTGTTYELTNPDALFYIIDPEITTTEAERELCEQHDFIELATGYKISKYDPETDDVRYQQTYRYEEAKHRAEQMGVIEPYDDAIETVTIPQLAANGETYWHEAFTQNPKNASPISISSLTPIWAAKMCDTHDFDGVFYTHPVNPLNHTAPRGAIYQSKIANWNTATATSTSQR